jgi:7-cyano-7-deazaguanine synthase
MNINSDAIVLFSAGLDSYAILRQVLQEHSGRVEALLFNVGQHSADRQYEYASRVCSQLGVPLLYLEIPNYRRIYAGAIEPPHILVAEPGDDRGDGSQSSQPMLLSALLRARAFRFSIVYHGATVDDFKSDDQISVFRNVSALSESIANSGADQLVSFKMPHLETNLNSTSVLKQFSDNKWDVSQTWSCQWGYRYHCGECSRCKKRINAFDALSIEDPTVYGTYPTTKT